MIPKKIHYCWFGGGKKSLMIKICIESWKRILPDFEIIEWNETNIDIQSSPYIKRAYKDNNWAFVADFVRFKVLYENGGLYFDTDVFIKKNITDFLDCRFFTQWEYPLNWNYLTQYHIAKKDGTFLGDKENPKHMAMCGMLVALMGAEKGHPLIKDCLDYYNNTQYAGVSSSFQNQSIVCDDILLAKLWKYGLKMLDERQELSEGIIIYSSSTFGGSITYQNKDNYAVHICSSTWRNGWKNKLKTKLKTLKCIWMNIFEIYLAK